VRRFASLRTPLVPPEKNLGPAELGVTILLHPVWALLVTLLTLERKGMTRYQHYECISYGFMYCQN
jgi:hypothetical protein